jgi:hypothetical protein
MAACLSMKSYHTACGIDRAGEARCSGGAFTEHSRSVTGSRDVFEATRRAHVAWRPQDPDRERATMPCPRRGHYLSGWGNAASLRARRLRLLKYISLDILLRCVTVFHRGSDHGRSRILWIVLSFALKHERRTKSIRFASGTVHFQKRTYRRLLIFTD